MASGIEVAEWGRLSVHLAEMWNTVRDPKKGQPVKPHKLNPYDSRGRLKAPPSEEPKPSFEQEMRRAFPKLPKRGT